MHPEDRQGQEGPGGDFLPGLDNGYVHSDPDVDEYNVRIEFHDAEGGEGHIECFKDMPITIERKT